ncbi:MAG: GntR family transcriptional regulator [Acidobacteria bacterium]|nr:GntR family transcriptional regulator [Acidobacteriota bacterium]
MRSKRRPLGETLTVLAYQAIRESILKGRFRPGSPLSRRRLAAEMGMSSVPVGEALSRLESEGVVESRPRAGTRVKIPSPEEIHGQYEVREALETHSARLFAQLAGPEDRRRLAELAQALDRRYQALDAGSDAESRARVERLHFDFHMVIAEATGCKELVAAIERSRVLFSNWMFSMAKDDPRLPERWHSRVADALIAGTPEQAAEAMRTHVRYRQREVIERFLKIHNEVSSSNGRVVRGPQERTLKKLAAGRRRVRAAAH